MVVKEILFAFIVPRADSKLFAKGIGKSTE